MEKHTVWIINPIILTVCLEFMSSYNTLNLYLLRSVKTVFVLIMFINLQNVHHDAPKGFLLLVWLCLFVEVGWFNSDDDDLYK